VRNWKKKSLEESGGPCPPFLFLVDLLLDSGPVFHVHNCFFDYPKQLRRHAGPCAARAKIAKKPISRQPE
jgi:hypothetical protein